MEMRRNTVRKEEAMSTFQRPAFQIKEMCIYTGVVGNPESPRKVCRVVEVKKPDLWQDKKVPEYRIVLLVDNQSIDAVEADLEPI